MKLDKELFKSIVKECLVEILAEGLYPQASDTREKKANLRESIQKNANNSSEDQGKRGSYLDQVSYGKKEEKKQESIQRLVSKVAKDDVMSSILADTAMTTLQEQKESRRGPASAGPTKPADGAARIVAESDPAELFGDVSSKWADLAFANK